MPEKHFLVQGKFIWMVGICVLLSVVGVVSSDIHGLSKELSSGIGGFRRNSTLTIEMSPSELRNMTNGLTFIRVHNTGNETELVQISVMDAEGHLIPIDPSRFVLQNGSQKEIPFKDQLIGIPMGSQSRSSKSEPLSHQRFITILARSKRDYVSRSFIFGDPYEGGGAPGLGRAPNVPFCYDKEVSGTCRYRSDPEDCFSWHWTAYATILNHNGAHKITSIPEDLHISLGEHGRVRIYLKVSCCNPIVQFISTDIHFGTGINSCVVDVRELQTLHPGEIAGIVIAAVVLLVVIIIVVIICARRRRHEKINHAGMLPRANSREVISRQ